MKGSILTVLAVSAALFVGCSKEDDEVKIAQLDFEGAEFNAEGYLWGKPLATPQETVDWTGNPITANLFSGTLYTEEQAELNGYFNDYGGSLETWYGFVVSNCTDRTTEGFTNDKSVYAEGGAGNSKKFAVASVDSYDSAQGAGIPTITFKRAVKPLTVELANTTYFYLWFKGTSKAPVVAAYVTITGWNNGTQTGTVNVQMANGTDGTVKSGWELIDLSSLGSVTSLTFMTENEDPTGYVPNYFALDNLIYQY